MKRVRVQEHGLIFEGHPDDAKTIAEELRKLMDGGNSESTTLNDFTFGLEVAYQQFYGLDEENYEIREA